MGLSRKEEDKVRQALTDALTDLCKKNLKYSNQLCIEGLLGITLDETDVFLVKIDEAIETQNLRTLRKSEVKSHNEPISKRGRLKKGRTRGRGRGRSSITTRKREQLPEEPDPVSFGQVTRAYIIALFQIPHFAIFLKLYKTVGSIYNWFGYNEHRYIKNRFLCIKIIDSNIEKFSYDREFAPTGNIKFVLHLFTRCKQGTLYCQYSVYSKVKIPF